VLLRLAYLGMANALAMLRLLPMSDRAKDAEILALRHQLNVLERQLHGPKIRLTFADRALLAALLHRLPRNVLRRGRLLDRPETVLRWHRDLVAARHARISRPSGSAGHPRCRLVALDPHADPRLVDRMCADPETTVRQAVASCPQLPMKRILALPEDPDLAEYAEANPALPVQHMLHILENQAQ
jgi:hypothetical protein